MNITTETFTSKTLRNSIKTHIPALGIGMAGFYGWTISLPSKALIRAVVNTGTCFKPFKLRWEQCTPFQQIRYLIDTYLPKVVSGLVDVAIAVPEITQAGNIHLHLLCHHATVTNEYGINDIRKSVLQNMVCIRFHKMKKNAIMALNYIHLLNDVDKWIEYMSKDLDKHDYPCIIIK